MSHKKIKPKVKVLKQLDLTELCLIRVCPTKKYIYINCFGENRLVVKNLKKKIFM